MTDAKWEMLVNAAHELARAIAVINGPARVSAPWISVSEAVMPPLCSHFKIPRKLGRLSVAMALVSFVYLGLYGCASSSKEEHIEGGLAGAGIGGAVGAGLGYQIGGEATGAGIGAAIGAVIALPKFPSPPPQWTGRVELPRHLLLAQKDKEAPTLQTALTRLRTATRQAGFQNLGVFRFVDGFALVTQMELITDDGAPMQEPHRFAADPPRAATFSLEALRSIVSPRVGRYRTFVFLVTSEPVVSGPSVPTKLDMESAVNRGAATLMPEVAEQSTSSNTHAEALVYEFLRQNNVDEPVLVHSSRISPIDHLAKAGIWTKKQLQE